MLLSTFARMTRANACVRNGKILEKTGKNCQNAKNRDFCKPPKGSRGSVQPRMASRFEPHVKNFEKSQNPQFHELGQISRESVKF
jgi:hypothetical protein